MSASLVKDFGTSQSPKSTRSLTAWMCPDSPCGRCDGGLPRWEARRHNAHKWLDGVSGCALPLPCAGFGTCPAPSPLRPDARALRLSGTTRPRFALHGAQRLTGDPDRWLVMIHFDVERPMDAQEARHALEGKFLDRVLDVRANDVKARSILGL